MYNSMSSRIVETELVRRRLYEGIRSQVLSMKLKDDKGRLLNMKENSNFMLRYLFNKLVTKRVSDDPVFVSSKSETARIQIEDDFKYHKIVNRRASELLELLDSGFSSAAEQMSRAKIAEDAEILVTGGGPDNDGSIIYKRVRYDDICGLVESSGPENAASALALNIRYDYLRLLTHGLANDYASAGYSRTDATEGFASAFNHYFDHYHSAFPDLEAVFGSRGSFFECREFEGPLVMVNPPFDPMLMVEMIKRVSDALAYSSSKNNLQTFIMTFPAWTDMKEIMDLKHHVYTTSFEFTPKDKTRFIDYMRGGIVIQPCAIITVIMASKKSKPFVLPKIPAKFRMKKTEV